MLLTLLRLVESLKLPMNLSSESLKKLPPINTVERSLAPTLLLNVAVQLKQYGELYPLQR